jgi:HEAT repeats
MLGAEPAAAGSIPPTLTLPRKGGGKLQTDCNRTAPSMGSCFSGSFPSMGSWEWGSSVRRVKGDMLFLTRASHRLGQGCLSAGFSLALIGSAAAEDAPAGDRPAAGVEAQVTSGRLTLEAQGAPLAEVLRAIGEAGRFEVVLRGAFAMPVRESFADRPLEDAIRDLVEGHSVVVLRDDPGPEAGAVKLAEIRVIEDPDLAASEDEAPVADEGILEEDAEPTLTDREAFRLSRLGVPPPTRESVLIELGDPDQAERVAAVPKVGSLGPGAALDILAGIFAEEEDPLVRSRAVAALTRLEGPGAGMLLRERALRDEDAELRMQALNALASSAGERSVTVLGRILAQDADPQVREAAISALQRVGGDWGRRYVENAAADRDPKIRTAAEQALQAWPPSPD